MTTTTDIIRAFWRLMATNDFASVKQVLSDDFVVEWPQSNERIVGPDRFVRVNSEYEAHGAWTFKINRLVAAEGSGVSDVSISDGVQHARAISFFSIENGKVVRMVEFWPEPYTAPGNRAHLTEPLA